MKFTDKELEAVLRLRGGTDWELFLAALARFGDEVHKQFVFSPENELAKRQGKVQAVSSIVEAIVSAPKEYDRRNNEAKQTR